MKTPVTTPVFTRDGTDVHYLDDNALTYCGQTAFGLDEVPAMAEIRHLPFSEVMVCARCDVDVRGRNRASRFLNWAHWCQSRGEELIRMRLVKFRDEDGIDRWVNPPMVVSVFERVRGSNKGGTCISLAGGGWLDTKMSIDSVINMLLEGKEE